MNNWRLLLLALVAVFKPIASFTDRNFFDGRQQCCDRQSQTPIRDTRSSLHGTYRLGKTSPALRHLNDRVEIGEDRRYELRQRDSIFSRPSTERPLLDIRTRGTIRSPPVIARAFGVQYRFERIVNDQDRESLLAVHERKRTAGNTRNLKPEDHTRKVIDLNSRDALERRNERANIENLHYGLSKYNNNRANRFRNEHLSENVFHSQPEMQRVQFRSGELRFALNREPQDVLKITRDSIAHIEASNYSYARQHIARVRLSVVRGETSVRADARPYIDNNNDREYLERLSEPRRSLFRFTRLVDRIPDMRMRPNSKENNKKNRRLETERFNNARQQSDNFRGSSHQNKENTDHRLIPGIRIILRPVDWRNTRESRVMNTLNGRDVDNRREIRYNERISKDARVNSENFDSRLSFERVQVDQGNIREYRRMNTMITRKDRHIESQRDIRINERTSRASRDETKENASVELSREEVQMTRKNVKEFRIISKIIARSNRDIENGLEIKDKENLSRENNNRQNYKFLRGSIKMDQSDIREARVMDIRERQVSRREIKFNEKSINTTDEIRESPDLNRSLRWIQPDRRIPQENKIMNKLNVKDRDSRQELTYEVVSIEPRYEIRENIDRGPAKNSRQNDRRDIRESKIMMTARHESDVDSRRKIRFNEKFWQIRGEQITRERQVESRSPGRVITVERDNLVSDQRSRSADHRNLREIQAEPKLSRSIDPTRKSDALRIERKKTENRERETIGVARSRIVESSRNRERTASMMVGKMETENDSVVSNWQYLLYTFQAAYLCALFMQMLTPSGTEKANKMRPHWLKFSSHYNPIKVD